MTDPSPTPEPQTPAEGLPEAPSVDPAVAAPTSDAGSALPVDAKPPEPSPEPADAAAADAAHAPVIEAAPEASSADAAHHIVDAIEDAAASSRASSATAYDAHGARTDASHAKPAHAFHGSAGRARSLQHRARKRENDLQKILAHLAEHDDITNDGIQKLVTVSDSTATRYAQLLVLRGKLFRSGKGRAARYALPQ